MTALVNEIKIDFYCPLPQEKVLDVFERVKVILDKLDWDEPDYRTAETHLKDRKCSVLLAKENEEIVGYSILVPTIRQIHLLQIAIHPSYHGRGVGTSLMNRVIKEVVNRNRPTLTLFTEYDQNQQRFYGKYLKQYKGSVRQGNPGSMLCTFPINEKGEVAKEVALHQAVAKGNHVGVKTLLQAGMDVDAKADESFDTPLHLAAEKGDLDSVRVLLDAGADIHARQFQGATPLHKAAKFGRVKVIELLVRRGAKVDALCFDGKSALQWATLFGQFQVVKQVLYKNPNVNSLTNGLKCLTDRKDIRVLS